MLPILLVIRALRRGIDGSGIANDPCGSESAVFRDADASDFDIAPCCYRFIRTDRIPARCIPPKRHGGGPAAILSRATQANAPTTGSIFTGVSKPAEGWRPAEEFHADGNGSSPGDGSVMQQEHPPSSPTKAGEGRSPASEPSSSPQRSPQAGEPPQQVASSMSAVQHPGERPPPMHRDLEPHNAGANCVSSSIKRQAM